ncbi:MAG: DUF3592 domain-containing protein [Alphaproteobacteria bacterium]|nr:MAG: DUF3592 domain-containing protein [Alphaproteobacteria bacterium]
MSKFGLMAVLFGAVFVGLALWQGQETQDFLAVSVRVPGKVIQMEASHGSDSTTYRPIFEYTTKDGQTLTHRSEMSSNPPTYHRGEEVEVLYDPAYPEKAKINGFFSLWGLPVILGAFGCVPLLIGLFMGMAHAARQQLRARLERFGNKLHCKVTDVSQNTSFHVNGRSPWRITALGQVSAQPMEFHSHNLWKGRPVQTEAAGHVDVLYDPADPKKYVMLVAEDD